MNDKLVLECTRAALIEYQRRQKEPSEPVARVILAVEGELQWQECNPLPPKQVINNLILAGMLYPSQREWAVHFYQRDQVGFWRYLKMEERKSK